MMDCDVVVVGAGPVGLWAACELRLTGASVVLLERRAERTNLSRALTIHARTLETFALRGIAERFMARGKILPTGHFASLEARLDFSVFDTAHPHTLFLPQAVTEEILEKRALELGVDIRREHVVEAIIQGDSSVRLSGSSHAGAFSLTASYAVGADGARSIVRQQSGIAFGGLDASMSVMMGDVVVDLPSGAPMAAGINDRGGAQILPLGDGVHHRVIVFDPAERQRDKAESLSLDQLAASVRGVFGTDFGMRSPIWLTRFGDETRLAQSYRSNRIFLAGDAAHIHAPMGGVGMNVGIQDAMNLGWKLGGVVTGVLPPDLLDSYTAERRPIGERLFTNTLAQSRLATSVDAPGRAVRSLVSELLQNPAVNRELAGELSGLGVSYGKAPVGDLHRQGISKFEIAAGERVPDSLLTLSAGGEKSLYSAFSSGNWVVLVSPRGDADALEIPGFLAATATTILRVETNTAVLRDSAAMLIRPDGYEFARVSIAQPRADFAFTS